MQILTVLHDPHSWAEGRHGVPVLPGVHGGRVASHHAAVLTLVPWSLHWGGKNVFASTGNTLCLRSQRAVCQAPRSWAQACILAPALEEQAGECQHRVHALPALVLGGLQVTTQLCSPRVPLSLPWGSREAYASTGYTPFLAFTVGELQGTVQRLLALGATLDGPIKYSQGGKVAPIVH